MFALGNATFACGIRSACKRSFEETEVERRSLLLLLALEPRPLLPLVPWTRPQHANRTPTWTSDFRRRYFDWNWTIHVVTVATVVATTATLSSNLSKSASFLCILLLFYGNSSPRMIRFLGKWMVTNECSRQETHGCSAHFDTGSVVKFPQQESHTHGVASWHSRNGHLSVHMSTKLHVWSEQSNSRACSVTSRTDCDRLEHISSR